MCRQPHCVSKKNILKPNEKAAGLFDFVAESTHDLQWRKCTNKPWLLTESLKNKQTTTFKHCCVVESRHRSCLSTIARKLDQTKCSLRIILNQNKNASMFKKQSVTHVVCQARESLRIIDGAGYGIVASATSSELDFLVGQAHSVTDPAHKTLGVRASPCSRASHCELLLRHSATHNGIGTDQRTNVFSAQRQRCSRDENDDNNAESLSGFQLTIFKTTQPLDANLLRSVT